MLKLHTKYASVNSALKATLIKTVCTKPLMWALLKYVKTTCKICFSKFSTQPELFKSQRLILWMKLPAEKWMLLQRWTPYSQTIYVANVWNVANIDKKIYDGLADTPFKERYRSLRSNLKHQKYENITKLVKYIWQLKCSNVKFTIKYLMATKVHRNCNFLYNETHIYALCCLKKKMEDAYISPWW